MHLLDNPVWHALTGPQATVAEGRPGAARYAPDVAPFAALPDEPSAGDWDDLRALVGPAGVAVLFRDRLRPPGGWDEVVRLPTVQMVGASVEPAGAPGAEALGPADVPDMLAIVERTKPGPFSARTIELGRYIGLREGGALVAMAGERMRLPGHTEISAVCTDETHRGRGLASVLVRDLVEQIAARGDTPILHALRDNVTAIRLYDALGFVTRREFAVSVVRAPA